jgi:hypothetical protein
VVGGDHRELVAAEAGHDVGLAQGREQAPRQLPQELVAGGVAEAVVDGFEPVQVEEQQSQRRPRPLGAAAGALEPALEQRAVGGGRSGGRRAPGAPRSPAPPGAR